MLRKIYTFAEWCHSQKDLNPEIWEAAYLAFYEHVVDDRTTYEAIPEWLPPAVFEGLLPQFEERPGALDEILPRYDAARSLDAVLMF